MTDETFLIGLDYGSESARGVLVDVASGVVIQSATFVYPHGILTHALPDGTSLPNGWALQAADDYTEAAASILTTLGRGQRLRDAARALRVGQSHRWRTGL